MSTTYQNTPNQNIVAGNWKMHKTQAECREFFTQLPTSNSNQTCRRILAVSHTLFHIALELGAAKQVEIFAQNCHWEKQGAFTGECSPTQLKDLGLKGTLIGHSERRQYFAESDHTAAQRAEAALKHGLDVIYCVGESLEDRKAERTEEVLTKQINTALQFLLKNAQIKPELLRAHLILAYEPVWAIGTGLTANLEQIAHAHAWIAQLSDAQGLKLPILYGGSVKPGNFKEILSVPHVSGGLVGGASLKAQDFEALLAATS